jgi:hypothetical protein
VLLSFSIELREEEREERDDLDREEDMIERN